MTHKVYRSRGNLALAVTIWLVLAIGCLSAGLASQRASTWAGAAAITAAYGVSLLYTRCVGVHVEATGVRVVNVFSRTWLQWDEIERFELAPAGVYPYAGHVVLRSGRDIVIAGITVPRFLTGRLRARAQEPINELNALLRASTSPAPSSRVSA